MLHLILGGAGCGKSEYLIGRIRAASEGGAPVRTLVPEPFTYTYDKRLYAALGAVGFNALKTGSFKMLTEEILSAIAAAPRDAADAVIGKIVLAVLDMIGKSAQVGNGLIPESRIFRRFGKLQHPEKRKQAEIVLQLRRDFLQMGIHMFPDVQRCAHIHSSIHYGSVFG